MTNHDKKQAEKKQEKFIKQLNNFAENIKKNQQDIPDDIRQVIQEYFWRYL